MTIGTIVFTFDGHASGYGIGSGLLYDRGIKGTIYADPKSMWPTQAAWHFTPAQLAIFKMGGNEIGVYSGVHMISAFTDADGTYRYGDALRLMGEHRSTMNLNGHNVKTFAPASRNWDQPIPPNGNILRLSKLASGLYDGVRVCNDINLMQTYPITDPLNVVGGGWYSLNDDPSVLSGALAKMDEAISVGGICVHVIHAIAANANGAIDTISTSNLAALMDGAIARRNAGNARICTFYEALTPP